MNKTSSMTSAQKKHARLVLECAGEWLSMYRANPHRFIKDYLHVDLHLFQKILIIAMMVCTTMVFIGSRGIGKTYLSALFCVTKCILYPGSKICVASGTRGQAINVLEKINLILKPNSPELADEIDERKSKINGTEAIIYFKNTSYIKVVTASDNARGGRATVLLLDEFRMIPKDIIDTILRKFLTERRTPKYAKLSKQERVAEYNKEKNCIMYLSSAYFVDHWSYQKCLDTCRCMLNDTRHQFICGLPYQLSIKEGMLPIETVEDEMLESDFNDIKFSMEYEALWYGNNTNTFFSFNSMSKNRKIRYPMLPEELAAKLGNSPLVKIPPKQPGEFRVLSADIALKSSKKNDNDATAILINRMLPSKAGIYIHNFVYGCVYEGMLTNKQALVIRKLFDEFQCDYLGLDTTGLGLGVYDALVQDMVDSDSGEVYPALSCCNNEEMADRCIVPDAERVIWAINASAQFNSDCAYALREGFRSGRIRLLATEYDSEEYLSQIKQYCGLSAEDKLAVQKPYINTTLLIDETTKLQYEETNNRVRVHERSGMRKDRYSSLSYNYYISRQIESQINVQNRIDADTNNLFEIQVPTFRGTGVNIYGKQSAGEYWRRRKSRS